jgi:hypothetical protein
LNKATRTDFEYTKGPFTGKALEAFVILKTMLRSEPIMAYPRSIRTYVLIMDASTDSGAVEGGMGAILIQINKNGISRQ